MRNIQERMGRGYTREAYLALVERVRAAVPGVSISSDFISGFCGETEAEHRDTITLMEKVRYDQVSKRDVCALCYLVILHSHHTRDRRSRLD